MPLPTLVIFSFVSIWLAVLGWNEYYYGRLPNVLTLGGAVVALILNICLGGWGGLLNSLWGGLLGFLFLLIPFLLRSAGAGDVKMLAAVGLLVGYPLILYVLTLSSVIGMVMAIWVILTRRLDAPRVLHLLKCCFCYHYDRVEGRKSLPPRNESNAISVPFGLAISIGTWLSIVHSLFVHA
jgi:prepilin peptidase CpaA